MGTTCRQRFLPRISLALRPLAILPVVFAFFLTACGGGAGGGSSATTTASSTPTPSNYTLQVNKTGTGTVTSSPSGINCGSACSASYASGTSVALTAAAGSGYTFSGWSGSGVACSGTTCTVAMSVNRIVTASFAPTSTTATTIRLIPATTSPGANELVSLAIPFPPDTLTDASRLRILDVNGNEVPAYVVPKVYWYFKTNAAAIRSVLVQFRMNFPSSAEQRVTFDYSAPRLQSLAAPNYAEGLMIGK